MVDPGRPGWFGYGATPSVHVNPLFNCISYAINSFEVEATETLESLSSVPFSQQIEVNFALGNFSRVKELIGEHLKHIRESRDSYIQATDATLVKVILKVCLSQGAVEKALHQPTPDNIDDAEALVTLYQRQVDQETKLPFFGIPFGKMLDTITSLKANFIVSTIKTALPSNDYTNTAQRFTNLIREIFGVEAFRFNQLPQKMPAKQNYHAIPEKIFTYIENSKVKSLVSKDLLLILDNLLNLPISSKSDEYGLTRSDHDHILKFKDAFIGMEAFHRDISLFKVHVKCNDPNLGKSTVSQNHH